MKSSQTPLLHVIRNDLQNIQVQKNFVGQMKGKNLLFDYCFSNFFPPTELLKNWCIHASEGSWLSPKIWKKFHLTEPEILAPEVGLNCSHWRSRCSIPHAVEHPSVGPQSHHFVFFGEIMLYSRLLIHKIDVRNPHMLNHLGIESKPLFVSRIEVSQTLVLPIHAQKQAGAKFLL